MPRFAASLYQLVCARSRRVVIVIVAVAVLTACGGAASESPGLSVPDARAGTEVDLQLPALGGGFIDFASFRGRVVVAHFSTTNSLTSQIDLRELRAVRTAEKAEHHDLALVEISLEPGAIGLIGPWAQAAGVDWPVALPTGDLSAGKTAFATVKTVPTTFVIDRDGRLAWRAIGPLPHGMLAKIVHPLETGSSLP